MRIEALNFSGMTLKCLQNAGIETLEELKEMDTKEIMRIRGIGLKSLNEIVEKLMEMK